MTPQIKWTPIVFLRYLAFFVGGILLEVNSKFSIYFYALAFMLSLTAFLLLYFLLSKHQKYNYQACFGLAAFVLLVSFGALLTFLRTSSNYSHNISNAETPILGYKGIIAAEVEEKTKTLKTIVEVKAIKTVKGWIYCSGKVLVYIPLSEKGKLTSGEEIIISGGPYQVRPPSNPAEFDYKAYLNNHQIYHQHFIKQGKYAVKKANSSKGMLAVANYLKSTCNSVLKAYITGEQEFKLASALILGTQSYLSADIKQAYSGAGVMHILAVSGMHIALVFTLLTFVLGNLRRIRYGTFAFGLISLSLIWIYAFITGLSPSVLRASVMFTFILTGKIFNRQKSIYNNLGLSAFCLLVHDPYLLLDVGFQLSFLAVGGIIYLYPKVYGLLDLKTRLLDELWKMVVMSLVAQLATFPLGLYYFHQFPTYFLFTNILLIPLSTVILYGGVSLLLLAWLSPLANLIGIVLNTLIKFLNDIVFFTAELPVSTIQGIRITMLEAILMYALIAVLLILFYTRRYGYSIAGLGLCVIISISQLKGNLERLNQRRFVVYNIKNKSAVDIQTGTISLLWLDSDVTLDEIRFSIEPNHIFRGIQKVIKYNSAKDYPPGIRVWEDNQFLNWEGKTVLFIKNAWKKDLTVSEKIPIDLIVLQTSNIQSGEILKVFKPKRIVADVNVKIEKLVAEAKLNSVPFYSISKNGAFVWEIK